MKAYSTSQRNRGPRFSRCHCRGHAPISHRQVRRSPTRAANQDFHFIGAAAFSSTLIRHVFGELRFANHILAGDVNGDGRADFEVFVGGTTTLLAGAAGDLIL